MNSYPPKPLFDTDLLTYGSMGLAKSIHRDYCPEYARRHGLQYKNGIDTACNNCQLKYKEGGIDKCNSHILDD
jgi:hypothetical protein